VSNDADSTEYTVFSTAWVSDTATLAGLLFHAMEATVSSELLAADKSVHLHCARLVIDLIPLQCSLRYICTYSQVSFFYLQGDELIHPASPERSLPHTEEPSHRLVRYQFGVNHACK
jgi:hypothetical protein